MKYPWDYMCIYDIHENKNIHCPGDLSTVEVIYGWFRRSICSYENDQPNFLAFDYKADKVVLVFWQMHGKLDRKNGPALIIEDCELWFSNGNLNKIENLDIRNRKQLKRVSHWLKKEFEEFPKLVGIISRIKRKESLTKYLVSSSTIERTLAEIRLKEITRKRIDELK